MGAAGVAYVVAEAGADDMMAWMGSDGVDGCGCGWGALTRVAVGRCQKKSGRIPRQGDPTLVLDEVKSGEAKPEQTGPKRVLQV